MTNKKETQMEEKSTRKIIVELTGYERNRRRRVIEVPASWTRDDLDRLSANDLDDGRGEWEDYGDGGIVLDEDFRLAGEAPDEAQVDLVLCGEPPYSGIEYQLRLRRRLLTHISANLSSRVIAEAEDGLWKLAKATLSLPEGTEHEIEDLLKEFARRQSIEPQIKGDAAPVIRRRFAMWLAEGVRYEIDFAVGEDGVAIAQPIDERPSMAQWLDEPVGTFFSAGGWVTHGEYVEEDGGPEFLAAIRRGEIDGPEADELEAAMQRVQAKRELVEAIKTEADLAYDSSLRQCTDIHCEVIHATEEEELAVEEMPQWKRQLLWASRIDRHTLYGFRQAIWHGQDLIRSLERWSIEEYAAHNLREQINWERYSFLTGNESSSDAAYASNCGKRFHDVAELLGEDTRRKIIDQIDGEMLREHGDCWHAFKASCKPAFFSSPHDQSALVRLAKAIPEGQWDEATNYYGTEYVQLLRDALDRSGSEPLPAETTKQ